MKTRLVLFFSIIISISCFAGSLWAKSNQTSLYTEEKAHKIGDILTVIISESASASQTASKDTSKEFSADMTAGTGFLRKISGGTAGSAKGFSGSGSTVAQNQVNATISVKVMEVLPNKNLVVEGQRFINVNNDIQQITLTGEVRPRDITSSNTID
ncbi:MAG: flagellar biosynthesis protein FlgH [Candidatus Muiribacterium halophilum]|uniref:Flagellar biosynthesis protein FlgH n=1 Tax=Muiribacterium halophilum TaxID=2053465 RepID=A0A2N5ZCH3_MUIH1|nr:MAG: flagellar biosynthesis protein FlgH [Candidatus Muirbacterium halophilum]